MGKHDKPAEGSFEAEFKARMESIIARGKAAGLTIKEICDKADVARATPDRWRNSTPLTVKLVDQMERVVVEAEAKAGK